MYAVGGTEPNVMYSSGYRDYMTADLTQSQPLISSSSGGGLARYRSAPSSFFSTLLDGGGGFADLLGGGGGVPYDLQFPATAVKEEQRREYSSVFGEDDGSDNNQVRQVQGSNNNQVRQVQGSNNQVQVQVQGKICGLARQSSSPAGFFSNLAVVDNGFSVMSDVGNFRAANVINEKSVPSRRLNDHINFSSGQSSSLRYMPQIAESGNESTNPENEQLGNGNNSNNFYIPSFENNSWEESNLSGLKRCRENEDKFSGFTTMDSQRGDDINYHANRLTHHLSLPKTSGEMAAIEKYLQFQQDAVPCKIRAKRGFATHPRSIAERVRRTRISDRMKKLQDLFPNMDKQTNTAEMLDLAVEYIKDLQSQVETLTGKKAKCTCSK